MRGCLQVVAFVVALVFIVTAVLVLFVVNLAQIVTDREAMKTLDLSSLVVEAGPFMLVEAIQAEARAQGVVVEDIDTAALRDAVREIAPPAWVDAQVDTAVDAMFDYLETGDASEATVEIDVRPIGERLRGEPGRRTIRAVFESLPVCPDHLSDSYLGSGDLAIPVCLPQGVTVEEATQLVHEEVVSILDENPDVLNEAGLIRVSPFETMQQTGEGQEQLEQLRRIFVLVRRLSRLLWLIPISLLLVIALLVVRSLGEWGHWWGWPLAVTAVIALLITFGLPAILTFLLRIAPVAPPPEAGALPFPPDQLLRLLLQPLLTLWRRRVVLQAGIMFIAGVGLIIMGFIGSRRPRVSHGI